MDFKVGDAFRCCCGCEADGIIKEIITRNKVLSFVYLPYRPCDEEGNRDFEISFDADTFIKIVCPDYL